MENKSGPFFFYQEAPIASGLPMYNKVAIGSQKL